MRHHGRRASASSASRLALEATPQLGQKPIAHELGPELADLVLQLGNERRPLVAAQQGVPALAARPLDCGKLVESPTNA